MYAYLVTMLLACKMFRVFYRRFEGWTSLTNGAVEIKLSRPIVFRAILHSVEIFFKIHLGRMKDEALSMVGILKEGVKT